MKTNKLVYAILITIILGLGMLLGISLNIRRMTKSISRIEKFTVPAGMNDEELELENDVRMTREKLFYLKSINQ